MFNKYSVCLLFIAFCMFISCNNDQSSSENEREEPAPVAIQPETPLQKGQAIAGATFATLSGALQKAMSEGGVPNAIQYCNLAAFPLVDSLSKAHNAEIRRTSLKIRNPANDPTEPEKAILDKYYQAALSNENMAAMIQANEDGSSSFYAPIKVNALCLNCHGIPGKTLLMENLATIHSHYPGDAAIGYVEGDLRGIWSIKLFE